jgi:signal transduction histidine kinase
MRWDQTVLYGTERSVLRLRLAAAALASTLLLLSPRGDALPAVISVAYAIAAGALYTLGLYLRAPLLATIGAALDVAFPTALVVFAPDASLLWILYAFAIGISAIRRQAGGAIAATAASLIAYDAAIALHAPQADATFVWAVQFLVAIGLIVGELMWARERESRERASLRQQALAFRAVARETSSDALVTSLLVQIESLCRTDGVWAWRGEADAPRMLGARGIVPGTPTAGDVVARLAPDPATFVGATLRGSEGAERVAMLRDLVADASVLYVAALERERLRDAVSLDAEVAQHIDDIVAARDETEVRSHADAAGAMFAASDADRVRVGAIAETVRERLAERERLARTIADLRRLVEAMPAPVVAWDESGAVALMSRMYAEVFLAQPLAPPDAAPGEVRVNEVAVRQDSGERVYRAMSVATGVRDLARVTVLSDITPERSMLQAREQTLATAAHELRHPLTAVHGWAQLMQRNLSSIQGQIGQLERLVSDLVSRSRSPYDELARREFDLGGLVREAVMRLRQLHGAAVHFPRPSDPIMISADPQRLAQAIDNVLQNAVKFSPSGELIEVSVTREGDEARIVVRDRGLGIAPEDLPFIFERSYRSPRTRESGGTGLGLAIAREVVTAHAGRIWAESEGPGRGSTFVLALPIATERATSDTAR